MARPSKKLIEEIKTSNAKSSIILHIEEPKVEEEKKEVKKDFTQAQLAMKDALAKRALSTYIIFLKDNAEQHKKAMHDIQTEIDYVKEFFEE